MSAWLTDTAIYTGTLIALVLLLRRPVARWFGPQMAYALWGLPFLRLVMPPIVLPAWMAPAEVVEEPVMATGTADFNATDYVAAAPVSQPALPWDDIFVSIWIGGALAFLLWRIVGYRQMRAELLRGARPVGEAGSVRLVETPGVVAPVAFGVLDKVVALPVDFMALEDRRSRDLAIAHELSHHKANDLLANMAAQPMLALHWFNPVAWFGWRAMRRDQEAACDARVMSGCDHSERATYGQVIAGFAVGPRLALAAPMACPVLGEKSIIHRLRSLTMNEISPRRRFAGRALLCGAALVLPLTASISYAETVEQVDIPPSAVAPVPPVPPVPAGPPAPNAPEAPLPPEAPLSPDAPLPPDPPVPPEAPAPGSHVQRIVTVDKNGKKQVRTVVSRAPVHGSANYAPGDFRFDWDSEAFAKQWKDAGLSEEEIREIERDVREAQRDAEEARAEASAARAEAASARAEALRTMQENSVIVRSVKGNGAVTIEGERFDCGSGEETIEREKDGKEIIVICQTAIRKQALNGLREARDEIARDKDMPNSVREKLIRQFDEQIRQQERAG